MFVKNLYLYRNCEKKYEKNQTMNKWKTTCEKNKTKKNETNTMFEKMRKINVE